MHGRTFLYILNRIDRKDKQLTATDTGLKRDTELAVEFIAIDTLDDRSQCTYIGQVDSCRIVQDIPPLPVCVVGGRKVTENRMSMFDARSDNHRFPVEHDRIPEMADKMCFSSSTAIWDQ